MRRTSAVTTSVQQWSSKSSLMILLHRRAARALRADPNAHAKVGSTVAARQPRAFSGKKPAPDSTPGETIDGMGPADRARWQRERRRQVAKAGRCCPAATEYG